MSGCQQQHLKMPEALLEPVSQNSETSPSKDRRSLALPPQRYASSQASKRDPGAAPDGFIGLAPAGLESSPPSQVIINMTRDQRFIPIWPSDLHLLG